MIFVPISRILYSHRSENDSYLSRFFVAKKLKRHSESCDSARPCTQVRNLAVAPMHFYMIHPEGCRQLSRQASLFAPLGLLQTGVTRYPAPSKLGSVRTFLSAKAEQLSNTKLYNYNMKIKLCKIIFR